MNDSNVLELIKALDNLSNKVDLIGKDGPVIEELKGNKKAKLKTLTDFMKKEFKDYLTSIVNVKGNTVSIPSTTTSSGIPGGAPRSVTEKVLNVNLVSIDRVLLEQLKEMFGKQEEERKMPEQKRSLWPALLAAAAGAIYGIVTGLIGYFMKIWEAVKLLFSKVKSWFDDLIEAMKARWAKFKALFSEEGAIGRIWKAIKEFFGEEGPIQRLWRRFKALFTEEGFLGRIWTSIKNFFGEEGPIQKGWQRIKALFTEEGFLGKIWKDIKLFFSEEGPIQKGWQRIKALFTEEGMFGKIWLSIKNIFTEEGAIGKAIKWLSDSLGGMFRLLTENPVFKFFEANILRFIKWVDIITNSFSSINAQGFNLKGLFDGIAGGLTSFYTLGFANWEDIKKQTDKIIEDFKSGKLLDSVTRSITGVFEVFGDALGRFIGWVVGWFNDEWGKAITDFFNSNNLSDQIIDIKDSIVTLVGDAYDWIETKIKDIVDVIKGVFNFDVWGVIKSLFGPMWNKVKNFFGYGKSKPEENTPTTSSKSVNFTGESKTEPSSAAASSSTGSEKVPTQDTYQHKLAETQIKVANEQKDETKKVLDMASKSNALYAENNTILKEIKEFLARKETSTVNNVNAANSNTIINNNVDTNGINQWRREVLTSR